MTTGSNNRSAGTDVGFTLLEMLVALSLAALLSVLMFGGLQFSTAAWTKLNSENEGTQNLQISQSSLRRLLKQALPIIPNSSDKVDFHGTATSLQFATAHLAKLEEGGLNRVKFQKKQDGSTSNLTVAWQPYHYQKTKRGDFESLALLDDIKTLKFRYFGSQSSRVVINKWYSNWQNQKELPKLVAIKVSFDKDDRRVWPELFISLELANK